MGARLGLDFGTATTCLATVRDLGSFTPELIPLAGKDAFVSSLAWVADPGRERPLVVSGSPHGRSPLALFSDAHERFWEYWRARVEAQKESLSWVYWNEEQRERSMLLSYFKPELADQPTPQVESVVYRVESTWDPMAQSENMTSYYANRVIANPSPSTEDLVAATAAIIRRAVSTEFERSDRISLLLIGVPSDEAIEGNDGAKRASDRRLEAVKLARIKEDFGANDFRVELFGEAQAAGYGIDMEAATSEVHAVIIDVGAGTTDMALVPYRRERGRRLVAGEPIAHASVRFAGRNINEAIAKGLCRHDPILYNASQLMDQRAWQILMDEDIEVIKRGLMHADKRFDIHLDRYAAGSDNGMWINQKQSVLRRTRFLHISLQTPEVKEEVQRACRHWRTEIARFLGGVKGHLGGKNPVAVEMVGGAFKFTPLKSALEAAMRTASMDSVPLSYRSIGEESQTVVARGLARRAALLD